MTFPGAGQRYLVDFVAFRVILSFDEGSSLTYSVVNSNGSVGQTETVEFSWELVAPDVALVTWQEKDKTTVVHIEDYGQYKIVTNITNPDLTFEQYHGKFAPYLEASACLAEASLLSSAPLSFQRDIKPMFRPKDITCMRGHNVLLDDPTWMCAIVNAQQVYTALSTGAMPPDTNWTDAQLTMYKAWMDGGLAQ